MKETIQIVIAIVVAAVILQGANFAFKYYQIKKAQEMIHEIAKPKFETKTITISPDTKENCLKKSEGIYNDLYLACRQGSKMKVKRNLETGHIEILESQPIIEDVNVL